MKLVGVYNKLFNLLIATFLFVAPAVIQAKNSAPSTPPANNSFGNGGRDKHSDELYQSYQQRRAGAQTPGQDSKAAPSKSSKAISTIRYSPIKKITFRSSPAAAPKGAAVAPAKGSSKSSMSPSSTSLGGR